jgi:hypothetical protein
MPVVCAVRNVCNQANRLKRELSQLLEDVHFAECETAGDLPFVLLGRAIAKGREAPQPVGLEATQTREYATSRPHRARATSTPVRSHVDTIAAANRRAGGDPAPPAIFQKAAVGSERR